VIAPATKAIVLTLARSRHTTPFLVTGSTGSLTRMPTSHRRRHARHPSSSDPC